MGWMQRIRLAVMYLRLGVIKSAISNKMGSFWGQSERIWPFSRPDVPVRTNLDFFWACWPIRTNFFIVSQCLTESEHFFEILSEHISRIFRNFQLALSPIFRGPYSSCTRAMRTLPDYAGLLLRDRLQCTIFQSHRRRMSRYVVIFSLHTKGRRIWL